MLHIALQTLPSNVCGWMRQLNLGSIRNAHLIFSLSSTETPPSASSDFGDSKYGDDTDMRASLRELERDHPEITTMPAPERPSRDAAPPLVDGYRRRQVAPMPARLSKSERRLLGHVTRSFDAEDPWFCLLYTSPSPRD